MRRRRNGFTKDSVKGNNREKVTWRGMQSSGKGEIGLRETERLGERYRLERREKAETVKT
jgi:hypothetical protein